MPDNVQEIIDLIPFQQTDEQIASLRLETQSISPTDFKDYKALVAKSNHKLVDNFGKYISQTHSDDDIANRFLVTDDGNFRNFENLWLKVEGMPETSYTGHDEAVARAYPEISGDFVLAKDLWGKIADEDKKKLIDRYGDESKAKSEMNKLVGEIIVNEEIAHLYQEPYPLWFQESGAQWYAYTLLSPKTRQQFDDPSIFKSKAADFYQGIIDKYGGEKVHRMFFGTLADDDQDLKEKVLGEFTEVVIKDLFPKLKVEEIK